MHKLFFPFISVIIVAWLWPYLSSGMPASDLSSHIQLSKRALEALSNGQLFFYDPQWLAGWPAFSFYGFLPHVLVGILSIPISFFSDVPVELSVRLLAVGLCALFPLSLYFSASQFVDFKNSSSNKTLAFVSVALAFWFLQNQNQFFGIGVGSVFHIGLFSQVFAWNLVLIHLGLLEKARKNPNQTIFILLYLSMMLLLTSHTLSAVFAASLAGFWLICFSSSRKVIFVSHILAVATLAFWLYPFLLYAPEFSSGDKYPSVGSLMSLYGHFICPFSLFIIIGSLVALQEMRFERIAVILFLATVGLFCSVDYLQFVFPLGVHFYRFQGMLVLFSLVPLCFFVNKFLNFKYGYHLSIVLLVCAIASPFVYQDDSRKRALNSFSSNEYVELDEILVALGDSGRVFYEYDSEYESTPYLSAHYLSSHSVGETLNGVFIESAPANRFVSVTADTLGAGTYHNYFVFLRDAVISPKIAIRQLQDMGVRFVVAHSQSFKDSLSSQKKVFETSKGSYAIFEFEEVTPLLSEVNKQVVGYLDLKDALPFNYVSYYFYSKEQLYTQYELVQLSNDKPWPKKLDVVLANGTKQKLLTLVPKIKTVGAKFLPFSFQANFKVPFMKRNIPVDGKVEKYRAIEKFFRVDYKLTERLQPDFSKLGSYFAFDNAKINAGSNSQLIHLSGLEADSVYRLNYNYFPFWSAKGGKLLRGSDEKMIIYPEAEKVILQYSYWNSPAAIPSTLVSLLSILLFLVLKQRLFKVVSSDII